MTDKSFDAEAFMDAAAAALALPIAAEHRAGVVLNLERLAAMSRLVREFPLADDIEAAPVFQP